MKWVPKKGRQGKAWDRRQKEGGKTKGKKEAV